MKLIKKDDAKLAYTQELISKFGTNKMFEMDLLKNSGEIYEIEKSDFDNNILLCGSHSSMPYIRFMEVDGIKGFRIYSCNGYIQECAEYVYCHNEPTYFCHIDDIDYVYRVVEWVKSRFNDWSGLVVCDSY